MLRKYNWIFVLVLLASCCKPQWVSISPTDVQQGDINVQIELTTTCTFFQDDGVDAIIIVPQDGITVHNIIVEDDTTLSFMVDVAEDSALGLYSVVVTYDNGNQTVVANNVLTVVER